MLKEVRSEQMRENGEILDLIESEDNSTNMNEESFQSRSSHSDDDPLRTASSISFSMGCEVRERSSDCSQPDDGLIIS